MDAGEIYHKVAKAAAGLAAEDRYKPEDSPAPVTGAVGVIALDCKAQFPGKGVEDLSLEDVRHLARRALDKNLIRPA